MRFYWIYKRSRGLLPFFFFLLPSCTLGIKIFQLPPELLHRCNINVMPNADNLLFLVLTSIFDLITAFLVSGLCRRACPAYRRSSCNCHADRAWCSYCFWKQIKRQSYVSRLWLLQAQPCKWIPSNASSHPLIHFNWLKCLKL